MVGEDKFKAIRVDDFLSAQEKLKNSLEDVEDYVLPTGLVEYLDSQRRGLNWIKIKNLEFWLEAATSREKAIKVLQEHNHTLTAEQYWQAMSFLDESVNQKEQKE